MHYGVRVVLSCYLAADTGGVNSWVVREYTRLD